MDSNPGSEKNSVVDWRCHMCLRALPIVIGSNYFPNNLSLTIDQDSNNIMKAFAPIFLALVCIFPVIALIPKKSPPSGRKMQRVIRNFKNSPEGDTTGDFILNHGNKVFRGERSKTGDKDVLEPDKINRRATRHKKWGVERGCPAEYWFDSRIHTLGNIGIGGAFHAATAPIATKIIDDVAYNGIDIRQQVRHT